MNADGLDVVAALDIIDLDELSSIADLQTREDRKYLVPTDYVPALVGAIDGRALEIQGARSFRYESIYFDTVDLCCYLGAARRRPRRFKVRTRTYLDSDDCMLEVKCRDGRGRTVKHRRPYALDQRTQLDDDGREFVESVERAASVGESFVPMLTVSYRRATVVLPTAARVTIDVGLAWRHPGGAALDLQDIAVVETKTCGAPCAADRLLWRDGHRPTVMSKYCTGLAALVPELPANKWHRTLQRHLRRTPHALT